MISSYIRLADLHYPILEGDLKLLFKIGENDQDFPCPEGYAPVYETIPQHIDHLNFKHAELPPQKINGVWKRVFTVVELSPDEKFAAAKHEQLVGDIQTHKEIEYFKNALSKVKEADKPNVQAHLDDLQAFLTEYPRVRERPVYMQDPAALLQSGSEPDVIG